MEDSGAGLHRIRVLIVDDHPLVREGLRAVLDLLPDLEVAGEAADGEEAIRKFAALNPDVTVMDLRLPKCSGLEACKEIRKSDPSARILALTSSNEGIDVKAALAAGASGFLLKGSSGPQVAESIRRVHRGETPISPEALSSLVQQDPTPAHAPLTARELEILDLVARGLRNQEIADQLSVALGTVKVHVNNILDKLGARDRTEAAMLALKKGMIQL
jgi:two-component system NarL family response regulator